MSLPALESLIDALDAHHLRNGDLQAAEAAWKAAQRAGKETFAPLKSLLRFKHGAPTTTMILQRCVESGGALAELADVYLKERPREVWRADGDRVALKSGALSAVWRDGDAARAAFGDGRTKVDVYDLRSLSVVYSLKLDAHSCCLVDQDTVRSLLKNGKLVEQKSGEKKARVLTDFGAISGGVVGHSHSAAIRESANEEGNTRFAVVVDGGDDVALEGVKHASGPAVVGDIVYVSVVNGDDDGGFATVTGRTVEYTWLPRYPSGGTAPPRVENAHQFAVVDGETFVITWGEGAPTSHRWLRVNDLVEDTRFGADFENIDARGGSVWSGGGDRVREGKRTSPIAFDVRCGSTIALDDDTVACSVVDAKNKIWLRRFRRHVNP